MAAGRVANENTLKEQKPDDNVEATSAMLDESLPDDSTSDLFPRSTTPTLPTRSPFFTLLTGSNPAPRLPSDRIDGSDLHLPFVRDRTELEQRVYRAFGPDVQSPDDIMLQARQGRAGTTGMAPKISSVPVKRTKG